MHDSVHVCMYIYKPIMVIESSRPAELVSYTPAAELDEWITPPRKQIDVAVNTPLQLQKISVSL